MICYFALDFAAPRFQGNPRSRAAALGLQDAGVERLIDDQNSTIALLLLQMESLQVQVPLQSNLVTGAVDSQPLQEMTANTERLDAFVHEQSAELDARVRGLARSLDRCVSECLDSRLPAKLETLPRWTASRGYGHSAEQVR